MNKEFNFTWLERFNDYIKLTQNRMILLLWDNCSAHETGNNLPELSNIELIFLLPNGTNRIQPLDAGSIIAPMKSKYRHGLLFRVLDNIYADANILYNVDILTAMEWVLKASHSFSNQAISNFWGHSFQLEGHKQIDSGKSSR